MSVVNHTRVVRVPIANYTYSVKRSTVPFVTPEDLLDFDPAFAKIEADIWLLKRDATYHVTSSFHATRGVSVQDVISFVHTECRDDTKAKDFGYTVYLVYENKT